MNRLVDGGEVHISKRPGQRGDVVAVYLGEAEAEGASFVCERFQIENFRRRTSGLHFILVEDLQSGSTVCACAESAASQNEPSSISPSPGTTNTRLLGLPCEASAPGTFPVSGCPPRIESRRPSVKLVDLKIALVGGQGVECEAAGP